MEQDRPVALDALQRLVRGAGRAYVQRVPLDKGKARLVHQLLPRLDHRPGQPIVHQLGNGLLIRLDLRSRIDRYVYYWGFYRPWACRLFESMLTSGATVVDVGANIGCYSLWAGNRVGPSGAVYAFEPEPSCYQELCRNIELNGMSWVMAHQVAASDREGECVLHLNDAGHPNRGQSSLAAHATHQRTASVKAQCLDAYAGDWCGLDVLKVDAQGAELQVLSGARRLLEEYRPRVMVRLSSDENNGAATVAAQHFLLERGYHLYAVQGVTEYEARLGKVSLERVLDPSPVHDTTFVGAPDESLPDLIRSRCAASQH